MLVYPEDYKMYFSASVPKGLECCVNQRITVLGYYVDYSAGLPTGLLSALRCWVTQRITMLITVLG